MQREADLLVCSRQENVCAFQSTDAKPRDIELNSQCLIQDTAVNRWFSTEISVVYLFMPTQILAPNFRWLEETFNITNTYPILKDS